MMWYLHLNLFHQRKDLSAGELVLIAEALTFIWLRWCKAGQLCLPLHAVDAVLVLASVFQALDPPFPLLLPRVSRRPRCVDNAGARQGSLGSISERWT